MAWLDDRLWCHPKVTDITDAGFRAYINGLAYSSGFATHGILTPGQQRKIGSDAKIRAELVSVGLWDEVDKNTVRVHDWDDHNSKRDARRAADRARKRREREAAKGQGSNGTSEGDSTGTSAGQSAGHDDGQGADETSDRRTLKEVTVVTEVNPQAVNESQDAARDEPSGFGNTPAGHDERPRSDELEHLNTADYGAVLVEAQRAKAAQAAAKGAAA
ncbi:MAG TPA: hypothetical protein VFY10_11605 [Dehalococcoidia bacterium]|nr:hypothetical protein [Dehalococcoidia bacterium]